MTPSITDWLMVVITAVYVVATILICYFNGKSAKAVREQTDEMRKQFASVNRPIISAELIHLKKAFWAIRFSNQGALTAYNTKIEIDSAFIENLPEQNFKDILINDRGRVRTIGVGQHYDLCFGSRSYCEMQDKPPIKGRVVYCGSNGSVYAEDFEILIHNYAAFYSVNSDFDDLNKKLSEQNNELAMIRKALKDK